MSNDANTTDETKRFLFPPWANYLVPALVLLAIGVVTYLPLVGWLALSPETTDVGYQPVQPVPFSHKVHAGDLKMDCRYCHTTVETAAYAAIPDTKICMNCHASIRSNTENMKLVADSYSTGKPVSWIKVHDEPDFVFFNHSAHVNHGVGCATCHGRIDQMEVVHQNKMLSMAWCLECHRDPARFLRPREEVTNMNWSAEQSGKSQLELGHELSRKYNVHPTRVMESCTTCHR
jgi:menaquinone reductase, multiheme cytochrome c subunit